MRAITLALGLLSTTAVAALSSQIPDPSVEIAAGTIASRFLRSPSQPLTQFRAVRHLQATNQRFDKREWMDEQKVSARSPRALRTEVL